MSKKSVLSWHINKNQEEASSKIVTIPSAKQINAIAGFVRGRSLIGSSFYPGLKPGATNMSPVPGSKITKGYPVFSYLFHFHFHRTEVKRVGIILCLDLVFFERSSHFRPGVVASDTHLNQVNV